MDSSEKATTERMRQRAVEFYAVFSNDSTCIWVQNGGEFIH